MFAKNVARFLKPKLEPAMKRRRRSIKKRNQQRLAAHAARKRR
jgi:hypothetical protein